MSTQGTTTSTQQDNTQYSISSNAASRRTQRSGKKTQTPTLKPTDLTEVETLLHELLTDFCGSTLSAPLFRRPSDNLKGLAASYSAASCAEIFSKLRGNLFKILATQERTLTALESLLEDGCESPEKGGLDCATLWVIHSKLVQMLTSTTEIQLRLKAAEFLETTLRSRDPSLPVSQDEVSESILTTNIPNPPVDTLKEIIRVKLDELRTNLDESVFERRRTWTETLATRGKLCWVLALLEPVDRSPLSYFRN